MNPSETGQADDIHAEERANTRAVAREGGFAGILSLLGALLRYGNNLILTRFLGAKLFGLYALANTVVTVVQIPVALGLPTTMVHFIASSAETGRWGRLRWSVRAAFRAVAFSSLAGTLVVLLLAPLASTFIFRKEGLNLPLMGLAVALPFLAFYSVAAGALQGLKDIRAKVFVERIAHPLVFSVLLLAVAFFHRSLEVVLVCFVIAAAAVTGFALALFRRRLRAVPAAAPGPPEWREMLTFSMPVMGLGLLQYFILWSDILVMGAFRPAAEVGVYAIASRLATGVSMPTDSLGASLAPSFSGLMGKGDDEGLRRLFHTSTRWIFLLGTAVGLALVLGGVPILRLFGKDFSAGYLPMVILAGGQMFSACFGANGTLITMTGHPKINMANALCLGSANLALNLYLVPRFGAVGAASSAALSMVLVNVARAVEISLILRIGPWNRTIAKPMLAFAGAVAAGLAGYHLVHPLAGLAGLPVYAALWWLLRPEAEDLDMIGRVWGRLRRGPSGVARR